MMIRNKSCTQKVEEKALPATRHSLNAFTEPRPGRTLELAEASKKIIEKLALDVLLRMARLFRKPSDELLPLFTKTSETSLG